MTALRSLCAALVLSACGPSADDPSEPFRERGDAACARLGGVPAEPPPCGEGALIAGGVGVWANGEVIPLRDALATLRVTGLAEGELLRCELARFPLSLTCLPAACPQAPVVLMAAYVRGVAQEYLARGRACW